MNHYIAHLWHIKLYTNYTSIKKGKSAFNKYSCFLLLVLIFLVIFIKKDFVLPTWDQRRNLLALLRFPVWKY